MNLVGGHGHGGHGEASPGILAGVRPLRPLIGVGVVAAGALAVALAPGKVPVPGLPDPGAVVRAGLPVVRTVTEIAAVLVVGALLAAVVLRPDTGAARIAGRVAAVWGLLALVMVVLTVADSLGQPLGGVFDVLVPSIGRLPVAVAWLVVAHLAGLVWLGVRLTLPPAALLTAALVGVAPVALTGHSSAGGDHDIASDSLMLHVLAMSVWVGGLAALLVLARRPEGPVLARRFSAVALGCWVAIVVTGVVNALLRVSIVDLVATRYGWLLVAKVAAVLVLGAFGYAHRRRTLARLDAGAPASLLRLGAVELLLMLLTVGLAVGLGRTAGPVGERRRLSTTEVLIGYDLPDPPSLIGWRFDLVFATVAVVAAAWYLLRVRSGTGRTVSWLAGCALLLLATCTGLGEFEPAVFSSHVSLQVIVGLVVPALLAIGYPLALANPVPAALAAGGLPVLLYVVGAFDEVAGQHWARLVTLAWSLVAGFALLCCRGRAVYAVAGAWAVTGGVLLLRETALGRGFYGKLDVDWTRDLIADQRLAGWVAIGAAVALALFEWRSPLGSVRGEVLRRASGQPAAPIDPPGRRPVAR
ncbi:Copper resistance protein D [Alloactinosynnema sp. L-07]|uniref:CopD family protein n=1 Tax=Alloactinosynnema sp. L-07 TaxID=1653480 RepID=UPI00065EF894|nr:CopD family protein [Alloactinosynnema sp. L-07]CRK62050.1 Copper resistance protein D [Alloactinosynnema sp. L-07]